VILSTNAGYVSIFRDNLCSISGPCIRRSAQFTLHIRPNFLYNPLLEIFDYFDQAQEVFESHHRSPAGEHYERIGLPGVGPSAWKISHLAILGVVEHPPLTPTPAAIDELKLLSMPGVKGVGHTKILF
jgi:hypothetical protein